MWQRSRFDLFCSTGSLRIGLENWTMRHRVISVLRKLSSGWTPPSIMHSVMDFIAKPSSNSCFCTVIISSASYNRSHLKYFTAIGYIFIVILWNIFPVLVCFTKKNLATLLPDSWNVQFLESIHSATDTCKTTLNGRRRTVRRAINWKWWRPAADGKNHWSHRNPLWPKTIGFK
jgi:hypothetical protein